MAFPRSWGNQMSAKLPPALAKGEEPKVPAINRATMRVAEFCARAQGIWKQVNTAQEIRYTGLRPLASDIGAQTSGPKANPKTYVVTPKVAIISVVPKSLATSGIPAVLRAQVS